jgi:hypothetical protein
VAIGMLVGAAGLSHLFLVLPTALLVVAGVALDAHTAAGRRRGVTVLLAAAAGALIAAPYWLPALRQLDHLVIHDQPLAPHLGLLYLLLPLHPLDLARGELAWQGDLWLTDTVPMVGLMVLGTAAAWRRRRDPAVRLAWIAAAALLVLVLVLVPLSGEPLAGPHSWRRLFLIRLALAVAAAGALASWTPLVGLARRPTVVAGVAAVLVLSGLWWQRPLRLHTPAPDAPAVADLEQVWRWLADQPPRGRLYVQDTFYLEADDRALFHSHLPALTAAVTRHPQVGAFYGGMPFATEAWTASQFGLLLGEPLRDTAQLQRVQRLLPATASGWLLLANPQLSRKLVATGLYAEAYARGRFQVLVLAGGEPRWVEPGPGVAVEVLARAPGSWRLRTRGVRDGGSARLSLAWAAGWRVVDAPGVALRPAADGRLEVTGLPAETCDLTLIHRPTRWPWLLAVVGVAALLALGRRRG